MLRGKSGFKLALNYLSFVVSASTYGLWKLRRLNPDLVFVFEPSPATVGLPAIVLGKIKRAPVVFWALDLWPETLTAIGAVKSPILIFFIELMVRFIYKHCDLILCQSRGFVHNISQHCNDCSKVRYFPNWSEEPLTGHIEPAQEIPRMRDGLTIMFAGNIGEAQDMPAVLEAADELKNLEDIRWIIVGDGSRLDWVKREVRRRRLEQSVCLPGSFPAERMPAIYAHANLLLVSLKSDPIFSITIPGKIQTYLMTGLPLLGMLDGEGAEVIQAAKAGVTTHSGDSLGLARAVEGIAALTIEARNQLGINGKRYAEQEFSRNKLIEQLDVFLVEAVERYGSDKWSI